MPSIDLNCDMGELDELRESDLELLSVVSSASIACGGHAGTVESMRSLVKAAASRGVAIGAHPGYPDRKNFGRMDLECTPAEVKQWVSEQVGALHEMAVESGTRLVHVKPHGAMYHAAMHAKGVALAVAEAVASMDPRLVLFGLAGAPGLAWWEEAGRATCPEAFADRQYEPDGTLRARSKPGAVLSDPATAAAQAVRIARDGEVLTEVGRLAISARTICIHGDSPGAVSIARAVRGALETAGWRIASPVSS